MEEDRLIMRKGEISCDCGQDFYFETLNEKINCIKCGKEHDVSSFMIKPAELVDEENVE